MDASIVDWYLNDLSLFVVQKKIVVYFFRGVQLSLYDFYGLVFSSYWVFIKDAYLGITCRPSEGKVKKKRQENV